LLTPCRGRREAGRRGSAPGRIVRGVQRSQRGPWRGPRVAWLSWWLSPAALFDSLRFTCRGRTVGELHQRQPSLRYRLNNRHLTPLNGVVENPQLHHVVLGPLRRGAAQLLLNPVLSDAEPFERLDALGDALRQRHPATVVERLPAQVDGLLHEPAGQNREDR